MPFFLSDTRHIYLYKKFENQIEIRPSEIAFWISAHFRTTLWSLFPSSSSINDSVNPFFPSPSPTLFSSETFTLETRIHWTREKAMPITAQRGMRINVARSGRIISPPIMAKCCWVGGGVRQSSGEIPVCGIVEGRERKERNIWRQWGVEVGGYNWSGGFRPLEFGVCVYI